MSKVEVDSIKGKISLSFPINISKFNRKGCYVGKVFVPITINNFSNQKINSLFKGKDGLYISYRLKKKDGSEFKNFEYNLSPISRDVKPKCKNNELMVIKIPNRSGTYHIIASLYYKNALLATSEKHTIIVR